ncbi:MAG TPA: NAD(P)/FAD-dependent oxidoreductase, partial [Clostridia bacterium]|nr:NAD(P)/FAD-dependent oxidoreductase [Clostridia bacterium]
RDGCWAPAAGEGGPRLAFVSDVRGTWDVGIYALETGQVAWVTAGGADTAEFNPKTMESKLVSGLYAAGEVLNIDGFTGGYNLQIAFSTAYAAGEAAAIASE